MSLPVDPTQPAAMVTAAKTTHAPRRMLINDEGRSALHFLDLEMPDRNWKFAGPGRDLQLIGGGRVLRSRPDGFVEVDLATGAPVREVSIAALPGGVESARRLPDGTTVVTGNGDGGIFVWELDREGAANPQRRRAFKGIDKVRLLRFTPEGTFLFCSETDGARVIHEGDWTAGLKTLIQIPDDVAADSMVKAVRIGPDLLTVSTGYAASILRIDLSTRRVVQTIGGKSQPEIGGANRPLSPFFFSGYQMFANGDLLVCNWQGHSADKNAAGYQILRYDAVGRVIWWFDQTAYPDLSSLNNVITLDGLDTARLHDEPNGVLIPLT